MKKIMFNDRYGLMQAVLEGKKTMTRRIVPEGILRMARLEVNVHGGDIVERIKDHTPLCYLDEVAIAQPYKDICLTDPIFFEGMRNEAGWKNKMFVTGQYMPHRIRIAGIKAERLQDISDEDCMNEGVEKWLDCYIVSGIMENQKKNNFCFDTPREAFAALIDRISGRGTWQRNPWVYAYTFELIK